MAEEYLYNVDKHNKVLGKALKSEIREKDLFHRGVHAYVMNSEGKILVSRRTKTKDIYPGLLELDQGGGVTYGEEYDEAIKREIEEELGIKNPQLEFLYEYFVGITKGARGFCRVYICKYDGPITPQPEEIESYYFATIEEIEKMIKEKPEDICASSIFAFEKFTEFLRKRE